MASRRSTLTLTEICVTLKEVGPDTVSDRDYSYPSMSIGLPSFLGTADVRHEGTAT